MAVTPELTEEHARDLIRASAVYARELAGKYKTQGDQEALAQSRRLDEARFLLEEATDAESQA